MKSIYKSSFSCIWIVVIVVLYLDMFQPIQSIQLIHHKTIKRYTLSILIPISAMISSTVTNANDYYDKNEMSSTSITSSSSIHKNILTNPILEGFRKADQTEFDNKITEESNTIFLLLPIINIRNDLSMISTLINDYKNENILIVQSILNKSNYDTKNLKKIFNQYADNIYYVDPNRANVYLGGGAVPDSSQTQKYLLRNEFITNINNLKDDINMIKSTTTASSSNKKNNNNNNAIQYNVVELDKQSYKDMMDDCRIAYETIQEYLSLVDDRDILLASKLLNT